MTTPARSGHSIARAVYDDVNAAIRTRGAADIVAVGDGANVSINTNIPDSSTEIGSMAGSRKAGLLIILQSSNAMYFNIGAAAEATHAKLTTDGESIFLPTNESVYGLSSDGAGSNISYVEL